MVEPAPLRVQQSNLGLVVVLFVAAMSMVSAIVGPLFLSKLNYRHRQEERAEDWRRQNIVIEKTDQKLDEIHALVNSQLTEAMKNELEALIRERTMMTELIELKKFTGLAPTGEALEALEASAVQITELRIAIGEREEQQAAIDAGH